MTRTTGRVSEEERAAVLERLVADEVRKPMEYFFHDCNAHRDAKLEQLRDDHGMAALGRWWILVELLSAAEGHLITVQRPQQWRRLANELECESTEECREFVGWLVECRLIDAEALANDHVMSARVMRNAERMAESAAKRKIGGAVGRK